MQMDVERRGMNGWMKSLVDDLVWAISSRALVRPFGRQLCGVSTPRSGRVPSVGWAHTCVLRCYSHQMLENNRNESMCGPLRRFEVCSFWYLAATPHSIPGKRMPVIQLTSYNLIHNIPEETSNILSLWPDEITTTELAQSGSIHAEEHNITTTTSTYNAKPQKSASQRRS